MLFFILLLVCVFSLGFTLPTDVEAYRDNLTDPERFTFRNVCYSSLDNECFSNGPPFYNPVYRPYSVVPEEAKDVIFRLFTRDNPNKGFNLNSTKQSLQQSPFNCSLETIVLSHGFKPNFDTFLKMKNALLEVGNYNVIVIDWQAYAQPPYYQVVANTRTVAARAAILIKLIMDVCKTNGSKFYLIGHSLGAQVVGYIGKRIPGIKRITGLDPAAPYFQGMGNEVHLNPSDADYVDTLHTSSGDFNSTVGFGFTDRLGDMDFYANDGTTQPDDCPVIDPQIFAKYINFTKFDSLVSCSHLRANQLFIESITSTNCTFVAVECDSYEDFNDGKCPADKNQNAVSGFRSKKIPGVPPYTPFVFRTAATYPFCIPDSNEPAPKTSS